MTGRHRPSSLGRSIYLFPLPALAILVFFFAVPTVQAFRYAVTDWDGYSADYATVGLDNLVRAVTGDSLVTRAALNNGRFLLVVAGRPGRAVAGAGVGPAPHHARLSAAAGAVLLPRHPV